MKSDIIQKVLKQQRRGYFMLAGACVVWGLFLSALTATTFHDLIAGPFDKTVSDLQTLPESRWDYYFLTETWINIEADALYPISAVYIDRRDDNDETYVMVAQIADRLLIIQSQCRCDINTQSSLNLTGSIFHDNTRGINNFYEHTREEFRQQHPDIDAEFLPLTLDLSYHPLTNVLISFALGVLPFLFGCGLFLYARHLVKNPHLSKSMQRLANYGDPEQIQKEIEYEIQHMQLPDLNKRVDYCLTENWILRELSTESVTEFYAIRYEDIVWLKKTWLTILAYDRYGQEIPIPSNPNDSIMQMVRSKAPWAVYENTKEVRKNWQKRRTSFIKEVDKRRLNYEKPKKRKQLPTDSSVIEWD